MIVLFWAFLCDNFSGLLGLVPAATKTGNLVVLYLNDSNFPVDPS